MNIITFPEFNIYLKISNIAFQIGNIKIYWYAIFIDLSFIIGILGIKKECKKNKIDYENILELIIIIIPISIIFARLYYVIFNLDYYLEDPLEIINIKNGGLAIYGGILGAVIAILIYATKNKMHVLNIFDICVPYLALGQAIGRWGNFFNKEAYGIETNNIFRMGIVENGIYMEVHPTFLYESICDFILFLILIIFRKHKKYDGQLTLIYLLGYSSVRFIIEGLRTDSLMLGNIRISQLISVIIFIVSLIILLYKKYRDKIYQINCKQRTNMIRYK